MSQALATLLDIEMVVTRILHTITDTIHVDFGAVWLRQEGDGYRLQAVGGRRHVTALPQRLDRESPLISQLERHPQSILTQDEITEQNGHAGAEIVPAGTTLLVPMTFERRLAGFLALGSKESGPRPAVRGSSRR